MKCPKCGFEQNDQAVECMRCGVIFSRIRKVQEPDYEPDRLADDVSTGNASNELQDKPEPRSIGEIMKSLFFDVNWETNPFVFGGRTLFFVILIVWGIILMSASIESNYAGGSFWHLVNLPFHEAGHIVFRPFGRIIHSLGGSLGQLLMPMVCFTVFLLKTRDLFAASFCIWWLGENFIDMAPYINDARSLSLPLLGGNTGYSSPYGFHDWEFILTELGLARYDHLLAGTSRILGASLMFLSFAWCGYVLFKQYRYSR